MPLSRPDRPGGTSASAAEAADQPSASRPIRVLLVDDHRLIAESLARVLEREPDMRVVGTMSTVAETREVATEPVDVVLMDYRLPDGTGIDATRILKARWPGARIVMLTAIDDDDVILEAVQAGADGYLTKDTALDEVVATVRAAHAGATLLPRSMVVSIARRVAEARERQTGHVSVEALTPRETEVLRALVDGLSSAEICERLVISPNTLRTHVQNIMGKLQVHSKLEAVTYALRHRLVEPPRAD
jgi:DNA-binding NarL/FixJ family response regulator